MLEAAFGQRKLIDHVVSEKVTQSQDRHPFGCLSCVWSLVTAL
jgi:hypothetical protein